MSDVPATAVEEPPTKILTRPGREPVETTAGDLYGDRPRRLVTDRRHGQVVSRHHQDRSQPSAPDGDHRNGKPQCRPRNTQLRAVHEVLAVSDLMEEGEDQRGVDGKVQA